MTEIGCIISIVMMIALVFMFISNLMTISVLEHFNPANSKLHIFDRLNRFYVILFSSVASNLIIQLTTWG